MKRSFKGFAPFRPTGKGGIRGTLRPLSEVRRVGGGRRPLRTPNALGGGYRPSEAVVAGPAWLIITGQSLANGTDGGPALSTAVPAGLIVDRATASAVVINATAPGSVELPELGAGYTYAHLSGERALVTTEATNGARLDEIAAGQTPETSDAANVITIAGTVAGEAIEGLRVVEILIHGESDQIDGLTTYADDLIAHREAREADLTAAFGAPVDLWLLVGQVHSHNAVGPLVIPPQVLDAARRDSRIAIDQPRYQYSYATTNHLDNVSYRLLGSQAGKVAFEILSGRSWAPFAPTSVTADSVDPSLVRVALDVPVPPLVIDTTIVPAKPFHGFRYTDTTGDGAPVITGVTVVGNEARVQLSGRVRAGARIRYAVDTESVAAGTTQVDPPSAGGNIRDSDATDLGSHESGDAYNWLCGFDDPVTAIPAAPSGWVPYAPTYYAETDSSNYLTAPDIAVLNGAADFTVDFWVNFLSAHDTVGNQVNFLGGGGNTVYFVTQSFEEVWPRSGGTGTYNPAEAQDLSAGWRHFLVTRVGGVTRFYVNGVFVDADSGVFANPLPSITQTFEIGSYSGGTIRIARIAAWAGRGMSDTEAARLYSDYGERDVSTPSGIPTADLWIPCNGTAYSGGTLSQVGSPTLVTP